MRSGEVGQWVVKYSQQGLPSNFFGTLWRETSLRANNPKLFFRVYLVNRDSNPTHIFPQMMPVWRRLSLCGQNVSLRGHSLRIDRIFVSLTATYTTPCNGQAW